jgi:protein-tyrosine kinase
MSKIEKALDRAKQGRGMALVRTTTEKQGSTTSAESNNSLSTANALQNAVSRQVSASRISKMKEAAVRARNELASFNIIAPEVGDNPTVQAFRDIRTRVLQHTQGRNGIILVTSATRGGGGSFVAKNLAVAFAFDAGRTSLLIDCNLSSPSLQTLLNSNSSTGLTDYLEKPDVSLSDIIHPVGIERLRVIPAGSGSEIAAEYFVSERVRQLFGEIRDRYPERMVIIDAPPTSESADTRILTELCDYVLLVVPYGKITGNQIDSCIKGIDSRKLIGVVFNDEPQLPPIELSADRFWRQLKTYLQSLKSQLNTSLRSLHKRKKHT